METEAQRGDTPPPRSHSHSGTEPGLAPLLRDTLSPKCAKEGSGSTHGAIGAIPKGSRVYFTDAGGEAGRGGRLRGLTPTLLPAFPQKLREPNPHAAGGFGFPAKFALTLQDKKRSRVPTGQAVTAVPFNRVYDFPGASQPGDARERARKRKFLGDVNAVKTLASGMHSSCPGKWWGAGSGAI